MKKTIILSLIATVGLLVTKADLQAKDNLHGISAVTTKFGKGADKELDKIGWTASASVNNAGAKRAIDDNPATRWETQRYQESGQYFILDMNAVNVITKIVLDDAGSPKDFPQGYEVYISNDNVNWGTMVASGTGALDETVIEFKKKSGRYIKIILTQPRNTYWSIHEFRVFGKAGK